MSFLTWNIISLAVVGLTVAAVFVVRRLGMHDELRENHQVTDPMLNVIGTLFAILLGFMVASAMTRFEEARTNVQEEAGACGNVFRLGHYLPPPTNQAIMTHAVGYIDAVIDDEWNAMKKGQMSDKAWAQYADLWKDVTSYEPKTQGQSNMHQLLVGAMTELGEHRRARAAQMVTRMPAVLWGVIFLAAAATVSFSFFFSLRNIKMQMLMTGLLAYVLCMNIFLLISFDEPFNGDVQINDAAFRVDQARFHKLIGH